MRIFRVVVREEWKLCLRCCRMMDIIKTRAIVRETTGGIKYYAHECCPPLKFDLLEGHYGRGNK